jgi:SAM-dependent methyltransferase
MRDRPTLDLFLISWLILFLELTCIRWFPSHVMFLTFFTNIVLLACFVGMSVGCLAARNPVRYIARTPVWLVVAVVAGLLVEHFRGDLMKYIAIGDRSNPDVVFFGAEAGDTRVLPFRIPVEVVAGAFFLLIATLIVGPGQEMGRAFNRVTSRPLAYSVNLLGSLAGIGSFAVCSHLQLPPVVWFAAVAAGAGYFLLRPSSNGVPAAPRPSVTVPVACLAAAVLLSAFTSGFFRVHHRDTFWSPYYRVDHLSTVNLRGRQVDVNEIETNLVSHQVMEPRSRVPLASYANYAIPYLLRRDAVPGPEWHDFKRVLIIGAGSGNDVDRALQWLPPDAQIDAVEIDPVIQKLGIEHHADKPYDDKRVNRVLNDGRNFLKKADPETYDLVIFALVDSLVLHSGYSNLRLESYLFTQESFKDVRRALKPTGVCAVYNYMRHGWLVARIREELRRAFEADPAVFVLSDKPVDTVRLDDFAPDAFTAFIAGSDRVIAPLRAKFAANGNWYWVPGDRPPHPTGTPGYFGPTEPGKDRQLPPPPEGSASIGKDWAPRDWVPLRIADVEDLGSLPIATDDWPFLYVREPGIPLVSWRGMGMMVGLSLVLWGLFRPREGGAASSVPSDYGLAARSFFLGAGFMLVETKAVVHMALLFGSTWMVNTVVFAAILVMSLAGTLYVARLHPKRLEPYYLGLFATIALGLVVPLDTFLGMDRTTQVVLACALVFGPIAFAGVIFATSFGRSVRPDRVFGANVAGALVGGLAENASVVLGFQYLLCVAAGFYLLSACFGNRTLPATEAGQTV